MSLDTIAASAPQQVNLPHFCRTPTEQSRLSYPKPLILLALPTGLEPVFPP
jgi:hypothetical protein